MAEFLQDASQTSEKGPILVQIDPKCLHSALKEFFEPLRTGDPRADFFTVYRKEAAEFDKDYAKKYDEDLNTTLIFAGLFSAVSSAFIIDVQSKLEPDPNDMTAAYMKILIHAVNASLFPDADPGAVAWTGPPPGIVTVQTLLYASLATSLFAAFIAVLGKQWVNRYIRNRGGSAADKSKDRQRKLDGFEKWHFHLVIESLPIMLQLALLLLGCALSRYLWTISRTIAGVSLAITLFGVTLYIFLTLAATIYYNCPYQTPPSIATRSILGYLSQSNTAFARSLRSLITPIPPIAVLKRIPRHLCSGVRHTARMFGCAPTVTAGTEHIPLASVTATPARIFEDIVVDWEVCKADVRCISWVLDSTTDIDVIFSTVRFAADTIWYPEIAGALSPHTLADLFFNYLSDGQIIPSKSEHAISIGMALASVLSVQLSMEPKSGTLEALCQRLRDHVQWEHPSTAPGSTSSLVKAALRFVVLWSPKARVGFWSADSLLSWNVPQEISTRHKLWLSRVALQTLWRCQHVRKVIAETLIWEMEALFQKLMADGGLSVGILRTNCFLIAAISLGLQVDFRDLYNPDNSDTLRTAIRLFDQQLQSSIRDGNIGPDNLCSLLLAVTHLDPFKAVGAGEMGLTWISEILDSGYPEEERYSMASAVVQPLGRRPFLMEPASAAPLLKFLSLCEKIRPVEPSPHPGLVALRILSDGPQDADFGATLLPTLTSMMSPRHPLRSRELALEVFCRFMPGWFSSQMETVSHHRLDKLLQVVGDPFHFPPQPFHDEDGKLEKPAHYEPMKTVVILIEFASSELWRGHLRSSNFVSCEDILSTDEGRGSALRLMFDTALEEWPEFLCTPTKIVTTIRHLEELGCLHTAQVVIMWAWVAGMADAADCDGWRLIGGETLRFYRTHGMRSLAALKRCIIQKLREHLRSPQTELFAARYEGPPFRVGRSRRLSKPSDRTGGIFYKEEWEADFVISQVCQLRGLYHLFGHDPATWQEEVGVEEVDRKREVMPEHPVTPDLFVN